MSDELFKDSVNESEESTCTSSRVILELSPRLVFTALHVRVSYRTAAQQLAAIQ